MRKRNIGPKQAEMKNGDNLRTSRKLYYYHELDPWQQDNHFIRSGYVKETLSYKECLRSLSYLHNESVNVYSHLVPAIIAGVGVVVFINCESKNYTNLHAWEIVNFLQFGAASIFCLMLSAMFHLFKSHSHKTCKFGNQCDYLGIIVMITSSLSSIILFAFHDTPRVRNGFIVMFTGLGATCAKLTFDRSFSTPKYRPYRSFMFIIFGLSGIIPILTGINMFGTEIAIARAEARWCCAEGFFYIFGACLYALRIPERFFHKETVEDETLIDHFVTGKFDLFGHSHQIFHVLVVIAAYCHWKALIGCYRYLHTHT